jgi:hypothetical protein
MGYGRQTKAAEREVTGPSIEEGARGAEVSVDRQLEEQIKGDLASSDEENLLPDEARKPSRNKCRCDSYEKLALCRRTLPQECSFV